MELTQNRLTAQVATSLELLTYFTLSLLRMSDHYKRTTTCLLDGFMDNSLAQVSHPHTFTAGL